MVLQKLLMKFEGNGCYDQKMLLIKNFKDYIIDYYSSIASASVPSAALVLMLIVLSAIDAPYQDVSLLWAIDWFV